MFKIIFSSAMKEGTRDDNCSNIIASDETQCTFNLNNYRVIYVVNQETTLYKKGSFTKAKQVLIVSYIS